VRILTQKEVQAAVRRKVLMLKYRGYLTKRSHMTDQELLFEDLRLNKGALAPSSKISQPSSIISQHSTRYLTCSPPEYSPRPCLLERLRTFRLEEQGPTSKTGQKEAWRWAVVDAVLHRWLATADGQDGKNRLRGGLLSASRPATSLRVAYWPPPAQPPSSASPNPCSAFTAPSNVAG
jgi:hypothetical protein